MNTTKNDIPYKIDNLSREQCAVILQKALAASSKFSNLAQLSRATGLNRRTINSYFLGQKKPRIENWLRIREVMQVSDTNMSFESPPVQLALKATHSAEKIKMLKILMLDELEYFRDATPEERKILKRLLPGVEAGYFSGLLSALYDEDQLAEWMIFSERNKGVSNGNSSNR